MGERIKFDPVACGAIVKFVTQAEIDHSVWQPFGMDKGFHQDRHISIIDGEEFQPTYNWVSSITARRRKDKELFYVALAISQDDLSPHLRQVYNAANEQMLDVEQFFSRVSNAIETMASFGNCECKVGHECEQHRTMVAEDAA
jgi:hypothetical protein